MPVYENAPDSDDDRLRFVIASKGRRLGGAVIDGLVALAISAAVRAATGDLAGLFPTDVSRIKLNFAYFAALVVPLVLQASLIANCGQSAGKLVMNTRIVDEDGRTANLLDGFVLRTVPVTLVSLLPSLALGMGMDAGSVSALSLGVGVLMLVDGLRIFGADTRTLHDLIAGTYVCVVGTQRILKEEQARVRKSKKGKKRKAVTSPE